MTTLADHFKVLPKVGDRVFRHGEEYIIAQGSCGDYLLVCLADGNHWGHAYPTLDAVVDKMVRSGFKVPVTDKRLLPGSIVKIYRWAKFILARIGENRLGFVNLDNGNLWTINGAETNDWCLGLDMHQCVHALDGEDLATVELIRAGSA